MRLRRLPSLRLCRYVHLRRVVSAPWRAPSLMDARTAASTPCHREPRVPCLPIDSCLACRGVASPNAPHYRISIHYCLPPCFPSHTQHHKVSTADVYSAACSASCLPRSCSTSSFSASSSCKSTRTLRTKVEATSHGLRRSSLPSCLSISSFRATTPVSLRFPHLPIPT